MYLIDAPSANVHRFERAVDALVEAERLRSEQAAPDPLIVRDLVTGEEVNPWSISQLEFREWVERTQR